MRTVWIAAAHIYSANHRLKHHPPFWIAEIAHFHYRESSSPSKVVIMLSPVKQLLLRMLPNSIVDILRLLHSVRVIHGMNKPKRRPLIGHYFEFWRQQHIAAGCRSKLNTDDDR